MAKFCSNCGTGLEESAKFCMNCGTSAPQPPTPAPEPAPEPAPQPEPMPVPAPQPEPAPIYQGQLPPQPQYPQQPFPQYPPQPQQPYPAAPPPAPKKKSKLPLVLLIIAVVLIGGIAAIVVGATGVVKKAARLDYYELGNDKIPSVKYVLGEERKITGVNTSINNGVTMKEYKYSVPDKDQGLEMSQYLTHLRGEGFLLLTDVDFNASEAWCKVGRNSVDSGYQVVVQIEYDATGYTIIAVKEEGEITSNAPATEDPTQPAGPTEPTGSGASSNSANAWLGLWRGADDEGVELLTLSRDGSFIVSIYFWDENEEDYDLFGSYSLEDGTLFLYDVENGQGEAYNDMALDCEIEGSIMTLAELDYWRVAAEDRADVLADPFIPYPYTSFRAD